MKILTIGMFKELIKDIHNIEDYYIVEGCINLYSKYNTFYILGFYVNQELPFECEISWRFEGIFKNNPELYTVDKSTSLKDLLKLIEENSLSDDIEFKGYDNDDLIL